MKIDRIRTRSLVLTLAGAVALGAVQAEAAMLDVLVLRDADSVVVTQAPYVQWSGSVIKAHPTEWIGPDQFIAINTDQQYQVGSWAIQIFTDNTQVANARTVFTLPDKVSNGVLVQGAPVQGPLTSLYISTQTIQDRTTLENKLPKGGLISADRLERLPLIWRIFNCLPDSRWSGDPCAYPGTHNGFLPPIVENDNFQTLNCDFKDCAWLYFKDKGDQKFSASGSLVSDWRQTATDIDYVEPLNNLGGQYTVTKRFKPTLDTTRDKRDNLYHVTQYIYVASNFLNATRQVYATTIFVELLLP